MCAQFIKCDVIRGGFIYSLSKLLFLVGSPLFYVPCAKTSTQLEGLFKERKIRKDLYLTELKVQVLLYLWFNVMILFLIRKANNLRETKTLIDPTIMQLISLISSAKVKETRKPLNSVFPYSVAVLARHEIADWVIQNCYETSNGLSDVSVIHPSLATSAIEAEE